MEWGGETTLHVSTVDILWGAEPLNETGMCTQDEGERGKGGRDLTLTMSMSPFLAASNS